MFFIYTSHLLHLSWEIFKFKDWAIFIHVLFHQPCETFVEQNKLSGSQDVSLADSILETTIVLCPTLHLLQHDLTTSTESFDLSNLGRCVWRLLVSGT